MESKLPDNWVETDIKTISTIVRGVTYKKDQASAIQLDTSHYILRGGNIQDGKIDFDTNDNVYVPNILVQEIQKVKKNDVVIVGSTGSKKLIGKAGIAEEDLENVSFGAFLMLLRTKLINKKFHSYFFKTHYYRSSISALAGGVNINNIRKEHLENLIFPLPPLAEQERIVAKLDDLFAQQEVMKKALSHIPALLKHFRQQVLTQAVTGKLTASWREGKELESGFELLLKVNKEKQNLNFKSRKNKFEELFVNADLIPKKWAFGSPDEICSPEKYSLAIGPFGSNLKVEDYTEDGVPLIFIRNIKANKFSGLSEKFVSVRKAKELEAHSIEGNDLIIAKMGDPPGDCELYPSDSPKAIITADCLKFRIWDKYFNRFFYKYIINSGLIKEQLASMTFGVAQQKISLDRFKSLKLPVPPFEEQIEIVIRIESLISKADAIEIRYKKLKEKIDTLPQAILHKTFKGELVAQLPTDGDAKDLLKEILAFKNEAFGKKKVFRNYQQEDEVLGKVAEGRIKK